MGELLEPIVAGSLALLGTLILAGAIAAWVLRSMPEEERPLPNPQPLDPEWAMEQLLDRIARSPSRSRGTVVVSGVRISACWVTDIEVHPSGSMWSSGYWLLDIDGYSGPCCDLEVVFALGLARLRAIVREREEAAEPVQAAAGGRR